MFHFLFNLPAHWPGDRWGSVLCPVVLPRVAAKQAIKEHFKGSEMPHEVEIHIRLERKKGTSSPKTSRFRITNHENGEQSIDQVDARQRKRRAEQGPRLKGAHS